MKKFRLLLLVAPSFAFGMLLASQCFAQTDKLRQAKDPIPNRYIVVLDDDAVARDFRFSPVPEKLQIGILSRELANVHDGTVEHVYTSALKGFSVEMSARDAVALSQDPRVKYIEEDRVIFADETQTNATWGLDRSDQRNLPLNTTYNYSTTGLGVHAYVIDTGIRSTHSDFNGRVVLGADFVGDGQNGNDCHGHGTHVAGTLGSSTYGVAKNVTIHNVRVMACNGSGSGSGLLAAVDWVTINRVSPAVANMSLGLDEPWALLESTITNSIASGVNYALAAGNESSDACNHSPGGRVPTAVTVGATFSDDSGAGFSNYGPCVDIQAPGAVIKSLSNANDTAITFKSGTSMASPHVAGAMARMLQANPVSSPAAIKNALINAATTGLLTNIRTSPNRLLYVDQDLLPSPLGRTNFALASNGGVASASSAYGGYPVAATINGDRRGLNWTNGGGWNDATPNAYPDWVQIDFNAAKTIDEIDVFTLQDNYQNPSEPDLNMTQTTWGVRGFDAEYWNGSGWVTVPNGSIVNTDHVWTKLTFSGITTQSIRVRITAGGLDGYSRITELEAWGGGAAPTPDPGARANFALASNGGAASASSAYGGYPVAATINGDRRGLNWTNGGGWNDATPNAYPDWVQIDFNAAKTIDEIDVFTLQDNYQNPSEPDLNMTQTTWGVRGFDVEYWNGSGWVTVPNGSIVNTDRVWTKLTFSGITTQSIRVRVTAGGLDGYSRITELEAWGST